MFILIGNVYECMAPINEIAIVSGQINANVSGTFSISGNVLNMNTSISGNIININQSVTTVKAPIVKLGLIQIQSGINYLPNEPVGSGVKIQLAGAGQVGMYVGGVSGYEPSHSGAGNPFGFLGQFMNQAGASFPITNLNQISIYMESTDLSGGQPKLQYFTYYISGE